MHSVHASTCSYVLVTRLNPNVYSFYEYRENCQTRLQPWRKDWSQLAVACKVTIFSLAKEELLTKLTDGPFGRLLMFHLLYLFYLRCRCCLYNAIWILQVSFMVSAKISSNSISKTPVMDFADKFMGFFNLVRNHRSNKFLFVTRIQS